jgi:hypothetical protein
MYALYTEHLTRNRRSFKLIEQVSLYGCNVGLIPKLLTKAIPRKAKEPVKWHLPIRTSLPKIGITDSVIIIDIQPADKNKEILLTELLDVWGYSNSGWTPILMRHRILLTGENETRNRKRRFSIPASDDYDVVHSLMYLNGSVQAGNLIGKWTTPGPSSTNSVLLWPDALEYFIDCINNTQY